MLAMLGVATGCASAASTGRLQLGSAQQRRVLCWLGGKNEQHALWTSHSRTVAEVTSPAKAHYITLWG